MNLSEWRRLRQQGEELGLPSGLVVNLRQVSLMDLAEQGRIPETLQPQFEQYMNSDDQDDITLDAFASLSELVNLVAKACLVGPEGLDVSELPFMDRLAIFKWANRANVQLQPFRSEELKPLGPA